MLCVNIQCYTLYLVTRSGTEGVQSVAAVCSAIKNSTVKLLFVNPAPSEEAERSLSRVVDN